MKPGITENQKKKCVELIRAGSNSAAVELLQTVEVMTLKDAKATISHVARIGFKCHWCQKDLLTKGEVECRDCRSLNFAW